MENYLIENNSSSRQPLFDTGPGTETQAARMFNTLVSTRPCSLEIQHLPVSQKPLHDVIPNKLCKVLNPYHIAAQYPPGYFEDELNVINMPNNNEKLQRILRMLEDYNECQFTILIELGLDVNITNQYTGNTLLHITLANKDLYEDVFDKLLQINEIDLNQRNKEGKTALHFAIEQKDYYAVNALVEKGADICSLHTNTGNTLLHVAAATDNNQIFDFLLDQQKIDINAKNNKNETALFIAFANGYCHEVAMLVHLNGETSLIHPFTGDSLLHFSVRENLQDVFDKLLSKNNIDIDLKNGNGETALYLAIENGHLHFAEKLVNVGADVNRAKNITGHTALHAAAAIDDNDLFDFVLRQKGIDVDIANIYGETALSIAFEHGHFQAVAQLIDLNVDICLMHPITGNSLLHFAAAKNNDNLIDKIILQNKIDVRYENKEGNTALDIAVELGNEYAVNKLIELGLDVSRFNKTTGNTLLHLAAATKNDNVFNMLLMKNKIDINVRNTKGETALAIAFHHGFHHAVVQLVDLGADSDLIHPDTGESLLHFAARKKK